MLYEDRSRAESFGAVAASYDRARPSYPPALLDALLADGAHSVLDVGCGTGIVASLLAARGCAVLGVEVDARMAEIARAKGVEVEVAPFEDWDAAGRRFDLLTAGQAWHWVQPQAGAARAAEVLRPGGQIGVFWNLGDPPPHVRERLVAIYARLEPEIENYSVLLGNRDARPRAGLTGIEASGAFGPVETAVFGWTKTYQTAEWIEHLSTHSDHHALPSERQTRLLSAVAEAIDALGGSFEMRYETVLIRARRL